VTYLLLAVSTLQCVHYKQAMSNAVLCSSFRVLHFYIENFENQKVACFRKFSDSLGQKPRKKIKVNHFGPLLTHIQLGPSMMFFFYTCCCGSMHRFPPARAETKVAACVHQLVGKHSS
jgi:hypothetical protein